MAQRVVWSQPIAELVHCAVQSVTGGLSQACVRPTCAYLHVAAQARIIKRCAACDAVALGHQCSSLCQVAALAQPHGNVNARRQRKLFSDAADTHGARDSSGGAVQTPGAQKGKAAQRRWRMIVRLADTVVPVCVDACFHQEGSQVHKACTPP